MGNVWFFLMKFVVNVLKSVVVRKSATSMIICTSVGCVCVSSVNLTQNLAKVSMFAIKVTTSVNSSCLPLMKISFLTDDRFSLG